MEEQLQNPTAVAARAIIRKKFFMRYFLAPWFEVQVRNIKQIPVRQDEKDANRKKISDLKHKMWIFYKFETNWPRLTFRETVSELAV